MKMLCLAGLLCLASIFAVAQGNSENAKDAHIKPPAAKSSIVVNISSLGCQTTTGTNMFSVLSWAWGASNPTTISSASGGAGAGKVNFSDLVVQKKFDPCSPTLFGTVSQGKHFNSLVLTQEDFSGEVVLTATLSEVFVSSWQVDGSVNEPAPTESVSFAFAKICIAEASSGAKFCWDVTQGKSF